MRCRIDAQSRTCRNDISAISCVSKSLLFLLSENRYAVLIFGEANHAATYSRGLPAVELAHRCSVIENSGHRNGTTAIWFEFYHYFVFVIGSQACMRIDSDLLSCGYHGVVAAYLPEAAEMFKLSGIDVVPVHVGAESLVAVDIQPCIAEFTPGLVTVEQLDHTGGEKKSGGTVSHVRHVGITMV